jgi:hypothetical protein
VSETYIEEQALRLGAYSDAVKKAHDAAHGIGIGRELFEAG